MWWRWVEEVALPPFLWALWTWWWLLFPSLQTTESGSSIYKVQAVDKDTGSGGSVTYYLQVPEHDENVGLHVRQERLDWSDRGGLRLRTSRDSRPAQLLSIWALYIQMDAKMDVEKIYGLIQPYWVFPYISCQHLLCVWAVGDVIGDIRSRLSPWSKSMHCKCVSLSFPEPPVHFVYHRQTQRRRPHKGRRNARLWEIQDALCHRHRQGNNKTLSCLSKD